MQTDAERYLGITKISLRETITTAKAGLSFLLQLLTLYPAQLELLQEMQQNWSCYLSKYDLIAENGESMSAAILHLLQLCTLELMDISM